jgi:hypothetical protein
LFARDHGLVVCLGIIPVDGCHRFLYSSGVMKGRTGSALRYAITTFVAVIVIGAAWEVFDVYGRGQVAEGLTALDTLRFNLDVWRTLAFIECAVVFVSRLSDLPAAPPGWGYAWATAGLIGVATVISGNAAEERDWLVVGATIVLAATLWFFGLRRMPGCPRSHAPATVVPHEGEGELR